MTEHDWLTAAMADTAMVAETLIKLRVSTLPLPSRPAPLQSWSIHQRRSRTLPAQPASNKSELPTASPSTPLSLSGATSFSGGGGGAPIADAVNSIQLNLSRSDISRSKVLPPHETANKRPRKKKTMAALKKVEIVLLEEQYHLKRKLVAIQAKCEKQIEENDRLRNIALDIQMDPKGEKQKPIRNNHFEVIGEQNDKIALPDLNVPVGEDTILSY
ncbi:hypothetical protein R6Q59_028864 [Mikania micrantha]